MLKQFQEKCEAVFRPELRQGKEMEQFQEKCEAVFRPELLKRQTVGRHRLLISGRCSILAKCVRRNGHEPS
ncbi:hypothetical protein [Mesorhizobium hawassense]|uniref:hypothetical protein n=1 Tax=Mesorhizobium hawassense TaxID=1209954 RepID=UPI00142DB7E4|nr:hypothetical protein [Mesorhizobium hawassense]